MAQASCCLLFGLLWSGGCAALNVRVTFETPVVIGESTAPGSHFYFPANLLWANATTKRHLLVSISNSADSQVPCTANCSQLLSSVDGGRSWRVAAVDPPVSVPETSVSNSLPGHQVKVHRAHTQETPQASEEHRFVTDHQKLLSNNLLDGHRKVPHPVLGSRVGGPCAPAASCLGLTDCYMQGPSGQLMTLGPAREATNTSSGRHTHPPIHSLTHSVSHSLTPGRYAR